MKFSSKNLSSALIAALLAMMITVSPLLVWTYGSDIWRGGALSAPTLAALGIVPLDVVRVLGLLMAVHYLLHLPKVVRNTHARIRQVKGFIRKCSNGIIGFTELGIKVAVPVLFYTVFLGGHHGQEIASHVSIV